MQAAATATLYNHEWIISFPRVETVRKKEMEKEAEKKAVTELKQEVQRVNILIEESLKNEEAEKDDDDELEMWLFDTAIHTLRALKELKEIGSDGGLRTLRDLGFLPPPKEFICPISGLVMEDPVVGSCGLSYERSCIKKWVFDGNKKWPGSDQELGCVTLISNNLLKKLILQWCENSFFKDKALLAEEEEEEEDDGVEKFYGLTLNLNLNQDEDKPPQELLCPISGMLMENPVLAASGQTFDELYIEKWVKDGNIKCPKTDQLLSHALLIPNLSINSIIRKWRSRLTLVQSNEGEGEDGGGDEHLVKADRDHLIDTLVKLPSLITTSDQLPLLKDLRLLTARLPSFRALFAELDGAATHLLNPFLTTMYKSDAALYNEVVATLMNISVENSNKPKIVQDCPSLIPFLIEALKFPDSIETRGYAAAALGQLSSVDSNSLVIGNSEAFQLLTDLLELGDPMASREAASAVLSLCFRVENRDRLFLVGGFYSLVEKLDDPALVDVILEILSLISRHPMTIKGVVEQGVLPRLFRIMEETKSRGDEANCVHVIFQVGRKMPREVEKVKGGVRILYHVSIDGSVRAQREASELLSEIKGKATM